MGAYKDLIRKHRELRPQEREDHQYEVDYTYVKINTIYNSNIPPPVETSSTSGANLRSANFANLVGSAEEVFAMALEHFPDRDGLPVPPGPPGRDPMVKRGMDKGRFFMGSRRAAA